MDLRSTIRDGNIKTWTTRVVSASSTRPLWCSQHWRPARRHLPAWFSSRASPGPRLTASPSRSNTIVSSPATCRAASSSAPAWPNSRQPLVRTACWPPPGRSSRRLRDLTGESAQLFRRQGDHRICVAAAERPAGLRDTIPVGTQLTMQAGSAAQILLAWEEPDRLHRGLYGAALHRRGVVGRPPSRLGPERRGAGTGSGLCVGRGPRPVRQGDRRGVGFRPDRAPHQAAREVARPGGDGSRGPVVGCATSFGRIARGQAPRQHCRLSVVGSTVPP